jgi:hypothetical protein
MFRGERDKSRQFIQDPELAVSARNKIRRRRRRKERTYLEAKTGKGAKWPQIDSIHATEKSISRKPPPPLSKQSVFLS